MGQVPTMVIERENGESLTMTQSVPIIEYLDQGKIGFRCQTYNNIFLGG